MIDYRFYLVTDDPSRYPIDWLESIDAAIEGGVTCIQYRDTENPPELQYRRIRKLQDLLKARHIPLIVNNNAELAAAIKAEGIHVGQSDLSPRAVRPIVGPTCEIGLSITDLSQVKPMLSLRQHSLVDLIGIGPVYDATKTKADAAKDMGLGGLAAIVQATPDVPNVAIGGITAARAPDILAAGAQGLAIVSAISQAPDPYRAAMSFSSLFA